MSLEVGRMREGSQLSSRWRRTMTRWGGEAWGGLKRDEKVGRGDEFG